MGREAEFCEFVDAHGARLLRVAYLLTGNQVDAEDLLQDALVTIYRRWRVVREAGNTRAYTRKVLVNQHLSQVRKKSLRIVQLRDVGIAEATAVAGDVGDSIARADQLRSALVALPPRQRTALVLSFYEGLGDDEIGGLMGIRPSTVRGFIARGLGTLRRSIVHDQETTSYEAL